MTPHLFDQQHKCVFLHSCYSCNSWRCWFPLTEEYAKDPVSKAPGTKSPTVPAEPDSQQQESPEIRIAVKEEEDEALNGEKLTSSNLAFAQMAALNSYNPWMPH